MKTNILSIDCPDETGIVHKITGNDKECGKQREIPPAAAGFGMTETEFSASRQKQHASRVRSPEQDIRVIRTIRGLI